MRNKERDYKKEKMRRVIINKKQMRRLLKFYSFVLYLASLGLLSIFIASGLDEHFSIYMIIFSLTAFSVIYETANINKLYEYGEIK